MPPTTVSTTRPPTVTSVPTTTSRPVPLGPLAGVIYAVATDGRLLWYRHNDPAGGAPGFANNGQGTQVGRSWNNFLHVFPEGGGVIYAVTNDGKLLWYRHNDPVDGASGFVNNGRGQQVGTGWGQFTHVFSAGGGVIYAVTTDGRLLWYRHNDPNGGAPGFPNNGRGQQVGRSWNNFTHIFPGGGG